MFKGQPKGLFVLALANMGERFGYYTMLAIFVLYMQAKFGFSTDQTSTIFAVFLAAVYFLPLIGGIVADRVLGYGKTIMLGIVIMFFGYILLAIPTSVSTSGMVMMFGALALIAIGTGFFKGNLQALVGNLYDNPKYSAKRDLAFSIFYMCINVGALFAPTAAGAVSSHFLQQDGYSQYVSEIPDLYHQLENGVITPEGTAKFTEYATQMGHEGENLATFGAGYTTSLAQSYNYGFAVACFSLILSMLVFILFRKYYKSADKTEKEKTAEGTNDSVVLTAQQTKDRLVALGLVFCVVIFFWMAFHQNGLTMTFFARDYTQTSVTGFDRFGFSLLTLLPFAICFYGVLSMFQGKGNSRVIGAVTALAGAGLAWWAYSSFTPIMKITPEIFQQFNPFFIVILTPVAVAFFAWLNKKGREPLAPRKIGIGMVIAALGFIVLLIGSLGLMTPNEAKAAGGIAEAARVSPNWLISTYFILTIAELFLSPMGISFVSKVAPPKYKGLAQGGWLAATAIGNYLVAVVGYIWAGLPLWIVWGILVTLCLLSASFLFSKMKKLEQTTREA
ncbi:MAG: peptide MFS transporter [Mucinivorans sp.]